MADRPFLLAADVAALWSELAERPITTATVSSYLQKSKPADPETGRKAGRYAENPVPAPDGYLGEGKVGNRPWWYPGRRAELRAWWRDRPGSGPRR